MVSGNCLISNLNLFTLKGHYYILVLSVFLSVSLFAAQEVHRNSRYPFKVCKEKGPKGLGAALATLGVVLAVS